jgi:hypothetical protein
MPLVKSGSKAAVGENIRREEAAGRPHKQAVAIALDVQRRAKHRHNSTDHNYVDGMHGTLHKLADKLHPVQR